MSAMQLQHFVLVLKHEYNLELNNLDKRVKLGVC
jgi:hypothetical protein